MPQDTPIPARQGTVARPNKRVLTAEAFHQLSDVPPAMEWFANIDNPRTRRAYKNGLKDFMRFVGIAPRSSARSPAPTSSLGGRIWTGAPWRHQRSGESFRPWLPCSTGVTPFWWTV